MMWELLRRPLGEWHPRRIYVTAALVGQKQLSLRPVERWIEAFLQEGVLPRPLPKYPNRCLSKDLVEAAKKYNQHVTDAQVANKLKEILGVEHINIRVARGWAFPPLPECRRRWEARYGGRWQWHSPAVEWGGTIASEVAELVLAGAKPKVVSIRRQLGT
jgi:hypothetical protein